MSEGAGRVTTGVWPGFPSDMVSLVTVLATQARGSTLVHDWLYELRLFALEQLSGMGADLFLCDPHRIVVTGPTTLAALLNSLQMGFRTLAIEKRSSEVWELLGAVKTEFGKFGDVLAKTKKKLQEASNTIDQAEVRTRAIERKLRKVQEVPQPEAMDLVEEDQDIS